MAQPPTLAPPTAGYSAPAGDPLTQPLLDFLGPALPAGQPRGGVVPASAKGIGWPCLSCGAVNPFEAVRCSACGSAFLAAVAGANGPSMVLPLVGDLRRFTRAQRLLGAFGIVIVIMVPVALISLLLTGDAKPAKTPVEQVTEQPTATLEPAPTEPTPPAPSPTSTSLTPGGPVVTAAPTASPTP